MGRGYEDVRTRCASCRSRIVPGEGLVKLAVGGREVTPPESPQRAQGAEGARRAPLRRAHGEGRRHGTRLFNDAQRQATKDAGRIAASTSSGS